MTTRILTSGYKKMTEHDYSPELLGRASKIKMILMDVDGVLTDGKLYYIPSVPNGEMVEFKGFHSHDGLGLHLCNFAGIVTGVISGRVSPATVERARILHMRYVYQGHLDKIACWQEALQDSGISAEATAFIGDDLPDIPLLRRAGLAIAVADARPEVKRIAQYVTPSTGGHGAVRDAAELVLKARQLWEDAIKRYEANTTLAI
jgi:3-deoxy-D-manno-octulosonate 8-phosphate phosphatase (KDO 8-P phosphatase)